MSDKGEKAKQPKKSKISKKSQNEKEPAKAKEKPPDMLNAGQTIASDSGHQYLVEKMLGKGGFGEVYQVSYIRNPERKFAMKVEPNTIKKGKSFLRLKIHVFEAIEFASDNAIDKSHFVQMHDKGKTKTFKYYVMDLIWKSLKDVFVDVCHERLSPSTLINTARQTLAGIEALHELGFLHRDIKPANYAVGLPPRDKLIYTMDFGIARPFKDKEGNVLVAREKVPFMGTLKYASLRAQEWKEQCRKDDIEVWMYMMLELYDKDNLWWRKFGIDEQRIYDAKRKLMKNAPTLLALGKLRMPREYCKIIDNIKKMKYFDSGDFSYINTCLSNIVMEENIDESLPLDWVGKASKKRSKSTEESKEHEGPDIQAEGPVEKVKKPKKLKENSKEKSKESSREVGTKEEEGQGKEVNGASDDTEVADSDENEEDRKKRKKERKARKVLLNERTQRTKDTSRDTTEDQDDKRKGGGPRRKNSIRKKPNRVSKKKPDEREGNVPRIPEPKQSIKEKAKERRKPSKREKKKIGPKTSEKLVASPAEPTKKPAEQTKKPAESDKPDKPAAK